MKRELHIFLTAAMFYTRIPCPRWVGHHPDYISLSTRYFPLIGWMVGGVYAAVIVLANMIFPSNISVIFGLVISILLTGAFHEDGLADACDGFGGGWTREKILAIMKDSRLGTYGVVGILLLLLSKLFVTVDIISSFPIGIFILLIVSSHSLSRMMAVFIIYLQPYARDEADSKAKPIATGISLSTLFIAVAFGVLPFLIFLFYADLRYVLALIPMVAVTYFLMRYFEKWIGGYTGDCLGATQQVNELFFLLSMVALWKFI